MSGAPVFHYANDQQYNVQMAAAIQQSVTEAAVAAVPPRQVHRTVSIFDRDCSTRALWFWHILLVVAICVIVPTVFLSFHVITSDKVAFVRDVYGTVDTSVIHTNGRVFLPLSKQLVYFDATLEPVTYSLADGTALQVFLKSGVQIGIEVTLQYRVDMSRLATLYTQFSTTYLSQIQSIATSTIKSVAIQFTETDYVYNRKLVQATLAEGVRKALSEQIYVLAPVDKFRLLSVQFPSNVVAQNLAALVELQQNQVAALQQQVIVIQAESQRQVAQIEADTTQALAIARVQASQAVSLAQNAANNVLVGARAIGLAAFFETLGVTNQTTRVAITALLNKQDAIGTLTLVDMTGSSSINTLLQV